MGDRFVHWHAVCPRALPVTAAAPAPATQPFTVPPNAQFLPPPQCLDRSKAFMAAVKVRVWHITLHVCTRARSPACPRLR